MKLDGNLNLEIEHEYQRLLKAFDRRILDCRIASCGLLWYNVTAIEYLCSNSRSYEPVGAFHAQFS